MARDSNISATGTVISRCGGEYLVELENGLNVLCVKSRKLAARHNPIKILTHDKVDLRISPYCLGRGIIIFRHK